MHDDGDGNIRTPRRIRRNRHDAAIRPRRRVGQGAKAHVKRLDAVRADLGDRVREVADRVEVLAKEMRRPLRGFYGDAPDRRGLGDGQATARRVPEFARPDRDVGERAIGRGEDEHLQTLALATREIEPRPSNVESGGERIVL